MSKSKECGLGEIQTTRLLNASVTYSDHLDDHGHVSVTRWENGEGFEIEVSSGGGHGGCDHRFGLTDMQWHALRKIIKTILVSEKRHEHKRHKHKNTLCVTCGNPEYPCCPRHDAP